MPKKNSYLTVKDLFCGAGGSSQGARRLARRLKGGLEVKVALNHWRLAIETHNTNFPDTLHDCTDISASDPRRYPSTDIMIASPECTTHSPAGGNNHKSLKKQMNMFDTGKIDPATERSRATMWDICRFAEYHKYNIIIVENVVEAKTRWALFDVWLNAMFVLGYNHRCVFLNSMHAQPTPQSRDRMYVVFWKKGNKAPNLDYMPTAHCPKCMTDVKSVQTWKNKRKNFGKYRQQYVYCCPACSTIVEPYYYASFNCIDWSDIGERIGDRKRPLVPKSMARVQYGLDKYGAQPMIVRNQTPGYCRPVDREIGTITTDDTNAILTPFLIDDKQSTGISFRTRSVNDPVNTVHTDPRVKLILPFIVKSENGSNKPEKNVRSSNQALATQTTSQSAAIVTPPFIVEQKGQSKARGILDPLSTATTKAYHSLITTDSWNSFITYFYGTFQASGVNEALGSCTTKDRHSLITYKKPSIEDCYYRMLKPNEIKLAMAFDKDYVILGNGGDQVKQCGNAVTPPAMEWLLQQCVESLS